MVADLLHSLRSQPSQPLRSLQYLHVECRQERIVEALTASLPHCCDLCTLCYRCEMYSDVSESVEEKKWEAAVRRCRNLEVVRLSEVNSADSCQRLINVLRRLSETEGIQPRKLRKDAGAYWDRGQEKEDYQCTKYFKHLLPALQQ